MKVKKTQEISKVGGFVRKRVTSYVLLDAVGPGYLSFDGIAVRRRAVRQGPPCGLHLRPWYSSGLKVGTSAVRSPC
jgi:hypothetical protein